MYIYVCVRVRVHVRVRVRLCMYVCMYRKHTYIPNLLCTHIPLNMFQSLFSHAATLVYLTFRKQYDL